MATTYEAIATVTVGSGGAANIEFTSIPGTYTDLVLKISGRHDASSDQGIFIKFNGSTSNRSHRYVAGNGTTPESSSGTDGYIGSIQGTNATASTFNNTEVYIPNYASSNNKSSSIDNVTENNATTAYANLVAGLWSDSAAITSIAITVGNGTQNFVQYSTATLYGIKSS
jgi:hypothetical protein